MEAILLSIKPKYVEKILSGEKTYEYRKKLARKDVHAILIYAAAPVKKVVAFAQIRCQINASPNVLWDKTKSGSGISFEEYKKYFSNSPIAYAYELGNISVFDKPKDLLDYEITHAPQSFMYVEIISTMSD